MRYLLAIFALLIAMPLLAYSALVGHKFGRYLLHFGIASLQGDIKWPVFSGVISFMVGIAFLIAGVIAFNSKPRREQ